MKEKQDRDWEKILERSKLPPRRVNDGIVLGIMVTAGLASYVGAGAVAEFVRNSDEIFKEILSPQTTQLIQISATGFGSLVGLGVGFSVERYIAEGEI